MNPKVAFIQLFGALFMRGEMLKAEKLLNCIPLDYIDDPDILMLRKDAEGRLAELRKWNREGRPFSENHANLNDFPKFELAISKIRKMKGIKRALDIGCYTGDFISNLADWGIETVGMDIHKELVEKLNRENKKKNLAFIFGSIDFSSRDDARHKFLWDSFDLITAFDVLEHTFDFDRAVENMELLAKNNAWILINLPRMTIGYQDEAFEHLRMFSETQLNEYFGKKKNYKMETCQDERGRDTSFISYQVQKGGQK